ncbi:MAG TPA: serine hydrolase [Candidatus Acidoferrum sp.]|nr:serine hydrolase [Candidatus Acidoferrum sp.]
MISSSSAQSEKHKGLDRLQSRVAELALSFPGTIGIYARNIETGAEVSYKADDRFPMASVYKIPIMVQVFREVDAGRLNLTDRIELTEADKRLGSGLFMYMTPGLKPTLHDLLTMMIVVSDNTATDRLLGIVGPKNVNAMLATLAIKDVRVDRSTSDIIADWLAYGAPGIRKLTLAQMVSDPSFFASFTREQMEKSDKLFLDDPRDHASPRGMADLLVKIFRNDAASEKSCREMLEILKLQQFNDSIPRYLPEGTVVAHKTGEIGYTRNDAAIIYEGNQHIVTTIFGLRGSEDVPEIDLKQREGTIARAVYDYFQYVN